MDYDLPELPEGVNVPDCPPLFAHHPWCDYIFGVGMVHHPDCPDHVAAQNNKMFERTLGNLDTLR